jgi:hypothetical protein
MRFVLCVAPWALALALGLAVACNKSDDAAPADAGPSDAGPDVSPCAACDNAATGPGGQCYAQASACNASNACTALATCISECAITDQTCIATCANASAASVPAYNAVGDCLCSTSCPSICGASCAGQYDAGPFDSGMGITDSGLGRGDTELPGTDAGGACTACESAATNGACSSEVTACTESASCMALLNCLDACPPGNMSCVTSCDSTDMAGLSDFNAAVQCISTQCSSDCGG